MIIQEAIDLAIAKNSNVSIPCSLTNEEIRAEIKDGRGCYFLWDTGGKTGKKILIVPPAFHDTLGGTGNIIGEMIEAVSSLDKIH